MIKNKLRRLFNNHSPKIGFIAGSFDVIHPGYIHMFSYMKKNCDYLIVGLHKDPTNQRKDKIKPILNINDRTIILTSIKYIDRVITYETEEDLLNILKAEKIDIRFLGDDYKNSNFTGIDLPIKIQFIERSHGWSTTKFKKMIKESYDEYERNEHLRMER